MSARATRPAAKRQKKAASSPGRESAERRRARAAEVFDRLAREYPDARTALEHHDPLELLVATVLSAQSTDARVNQVTPALFRRCPTAADYATIPTTELEELIHSTGFFRAKSRALRGIGAALVERHGGRVPETMEELVELPGVGRKTANVVLGSAFGRNVGVVVDTHVARVSARLGFTRQTDPVKIERDLCALFPQERWTLLAHLLILHGRAICKAPRPRCAECPVAALCPAARLWL